jgi:hypothetical protein
MKAQILSQAQSFHKKEKIKCLQFCEGILGAFTLALLVPQVDVDFTLGPPL